MTIIEDISTLNYLRLNRYQLYHLFFQYKKNNYDRNRYSRLSKLRK
jgi:hypothetical protein